MICYFREYIRNISQRSTHLRSLLSQKPRLRGQVNMKLNFKISNLPYFLRISFCTTQIGMEIFKFPPMLAKQDVVQCWHRNITAPFGLFVLLLKHVRPPNHLGLQHTKNFLLSNGLSNKFINPRKSCSFYYYRFMSLKIEKL